MKVELSPVEIAHLIMCIECVDFLDKEDEKLIEKLKKYIEWGTDGSS